MPYQVLVVEDDKTLLEMLQFNLVRQGYDVITAETGQDGLKQVREKQPDLVILDVMLPGMDGFEVCRAVRREFSMPILMLTARTEEIDKIVGLEMGADDYITKPFSMREMLARVKAQLRRVELVREDVAAEQVVSQSTDSMHRSALLVFDTLVVDETRREVRVEDKAIRLKPKEFDLLLFLVRHQGIALSRDLILERVWGWSYDGNSRTVDVHVRWLREKIEPDPANARRIVTVRGIGYRFDE